MLKRYIPLLVVAMSLLFAAPALAGEFGLQSAEVSATNQPTPEEEANHEPGTPDLQAGSHPYSLVTGFFLNQPEYIPGNRHEDNSAGGDLRGVRVQLPPGFVGDPEATPRCTPNELENNACPIDTQVGYESLFVLGDEGLVYQYYEHVFNMQPPPGMPAQFAFRVLGDASIWLDVSVRTGGDYGLTITVPNIEQVLRVYVSITTIWGVPAAAVHDPHRGVCLEEDLTPVGLPGISGEPTFSEIPLARYRELALDPPSGGDCSVLSLIHI